ncbi:ABC transporter substrate-binding protein [Rhodopila sp.]|jgi:multiple sugar transport system substrate-binding protein|uniref:ABC transporter substrate-binding protein n=1 Tax=Rhodopila sp. TaxID=2480087 RepID=UPI002B91679C|nr:sugar ABC transporter substrate-binding protein [Rhodopila sp.]HVZ08419.1 sugar ABC transporter substrate-binding protein [Rhodopila sp.]
MIRRRQVLKAGAVALAAPALVERANAQSQFDWKQFKGQSIEVNFQLSPRADLIKRNLPKFEELTGIRVGFESIPEQQQRPKVAMEMATGHPSFDVVNVGMHVQKRLVERANWMDDLRPYIADKTISNPDLDMADFSPASMQVATAPDGKINVIPNNQDLFIIFYNKALLAEKGFNAAPKTYDEMMSMAHALTDPKKGVYGFVGRGLKNANVVLYDNILLGWDQETVTPDGKKLLTDTPEAIEAASWYQKIMREYGPPGNIGFNWNECQTTFMQGRGAMWWDGIGFSAPLLDKTKSKVVDKVGFAVVPAGPKAQHSATFIEGIGIPAQAKNKKPAWLFIQWAAGKDMLTEVLRSGSGTPARLSPYAREDVIANSSFPKEWFETTITSLKIARSGLPVIVPVTEFRDTIGAALTSIIGGAEPAPELKKATEAFQPVLDKSNQA